MAEADDLKKALSVDRFNVYPNDANAAKQYDFWLKRFNIYVTSIKANDAEKLQILINKLNADTYEYIDSLTTYDDAVAKLDAIFKKKPNILYARYQLNTTNQNSGETIDAYALRLSVLAKSCNFENVTAKQYQDESVLGSFIRGIEESFIRQRLLEAETLTLAEAIKHAEILKRAHENANFF